MSIPFGYKLLENTVSLTILSLWFKISAQGLYREKRGLIFPFLLMSQMCSLNSQHIFLEHFSS